MNRRIDPPLSALNLADAAAALGIGESLLREQTAPGAALEWLVLHIGKRQVIPLCRIAALCAMPPPTPVAAPDLTWIAWHV